MFRFCELPIGEIAVDEVLGLVVYSINGLRAVSISFSIYHNYKTAGGTPGILGSRPSG